MQASQNFHQQSVPQISNYHVSSTETSSQANTEHQYFTLESTPAMDYSVYSSPSAASYSITSPFSPQFSHSLDSDLLNSSDNNYGSPLSGSSGVDDDNKLINVLWALRNELLGPESDIDYNVSFDGQSSPFSKYSKIIEMAPSMDLKQLLIACAEVVSETDSAFSPNRSKALSAAEALMELLEKKVSVSGDPLQRLGAYMLEGLRARLLSSGSIIYKKLKCKEPTSSELLSYMHVLYEICPYYKFAYMSANVFIREAMKNEDQIHIIDFQIAQGSQWISFLQDVSRRSGGPPFIRITGVDDSQSAHARGGGLQLVGERLAKYADSCGVPFEFHGAAISGCEVHLENLSIREGEALAVNFPYILHHMPDESVSIINHRDRLLRLVKSLSPTIVTLVEQESNTNTSTFFQRFYETLEYYTAMFESIDAALGKDDKKRISAEEHCVARDIVNIIACEGTDRVERHELFGKWKSRFMMAGFCPIELNPLVNLTIRELLKGYNSNYMLSESDGALYLGWKNRALATSSAWR